MSILTGIFIFAGGGACGFLVAALFSINRRDGE